MISADRDIVGIDRCSGATSSVDGSGGQAY
jgi:hypothetical protein